MLKIKKREGSLTGPNEKRSKKETILHILRASLIAVAAAVILLFAGNILFYGATGTTVSACYKEAELTVADSTNATFTLNEPTRIYYSDGTVMAVLRKDAASDYLTYDQIPEYAVNAFVAVEDRSFWSNKGYEIKAMARAALSILTDREISQGGSTITQQLCKLVFLNNEKTVERKVKEIFLAKNVTEKYSKEQIMEWYINYCCFANNIYGLEDAAETYLEKEAGDLTLSETCYLCAIPNRPEYYDPWKDPKKAIERRDQILNGMRGLGMISEEELQNALAEEITVIPPSGEPDVRYNSETTYAIHCAAEILMEQDGFPFTNRFDTMEDYESYQEDYEDAYTEAKERLYTDGYSIKTSIDPQKQQRIQEIVDKELELSSSVNDAGVYKLQGAVTAVDNRTHKVVAIVGSRSQEGMENSNYNRAFQFYRQPGSSIKPLIIYAPALMMGYTADSMLKNVDVDHAYQAFRDNKAVSDLYGQPVSLRRSVIRSLNGPALYLYDAVTPEKGLSYLLNMDFARIVPDDYFLSSGLGGMTYGVNTVEMAGAYSSLANFGRYTKVDCITSMTDQQGEELYQTKSPSQVYDANAAAAITDIMTGVIESGTASQMDWSSDSDLPAAGKTGTTNSDTNGWFCGYTDPYTITVWVGNDDNTPVEGLSAGKYPIYIWRDAMLSLTEGYQGQEENSVFQANTQVSPDAGTEGVPGMWTVLGSGANVRDSAGSGSRVLFSLSGGTQVYVVSRDDYWSEVVIDGSHYYIYSPLLTQ